MIDDTEAETITQIFTERPEGWLATYLTDKRAVAFFKTRMTKKNNNFDAIYFHTADPNVFQKIATWKNKL